MVPILATWNQGAFFHVISWELPVSATFNGNIRMFSTDPWENAKVCAQARDIARTNPDRWALLTELIEMWTNLANHQPFLTPEESASEFDKIGALHAKLLGPQPSVAMH
jgi:hypothetical protein